MTSRATNLRRWQFRSVCLYLLLLPQWIGCGESQDEVDRLAAEARGRAEEIEQIAASVESVLKSTDLGVWQVVEPVTFRHGVSGPIRSSWVATISFTVMFPIVIEETEQQNLVRHNGRFVYHLGQWRLQQVGVAFEYFDAPVYTAESDLLAVPLVDGGRLADLKSLWVDSVQAAIEAQAAERERELEREAKEAEEAEAAAEAEAKERDEKDAKSGDAKEALKTLLDTLGDE